MFLKIKYPQFATAIVCTYEKSDEKKTVMLTTSNGNVTIKHGKVINEAGSNYFTNNGTQKPYLIVNPIISVEDLEHAKKIAETIPYLANYPGENDDQKLALLGAIKNLIKPNNYTNVKSIDPIFKICELPQKQMVINWEFENDLYTIAKFKVKPGKHYATVVNFENVQPEINYDNLKLCLQHFPNTMLAKLWGIKSVNNVENTPRVKKVLIKPAELLLKTAEKILERNKVQNPTATPDDFAKLRYESLLNKEKLTPKEKAEFKKLTETFGTS